MVHIAKLESRLGSKARLKSKVRLFICVKISRLGLLGSKYKTEAMISLYLVAQSILNTLKNWKALLKVRKLLLKTSFYRCARNCGKFRLFKVAPIWLHAEMRRWMERRSLPIQMTFPPRLNHGS